MARSRLFGSVLAGVVSVGSLALSTPAATAAPHVRSAVATPYRTAVLADTPSAYWRLDELGGPTAADSSGHGLTGTYGSVTGYQRAGALVADDNPAVSVSGTALSAASDTLPGGSAARTVEFWTLTAGCCGTASVGYGDLADGAGFTASYSFDGGVLTIGNGVSAQSVTLGQPFDVDDANWHLLDFSYAAGKVTFFVDGVSVGSAPMAGLDTTAAGTVDVASRGALDEVAIYPKALSAARVAAHWTAGSSESPSCAAAPTGAYPSAVRADAPAAYFRSDDIVADPSGRVAYDASGNCHNGSYRYTDTSTTGGLVGDTDTALSGQFTGPSTSLPAGTQDRTVEFWAASSGCCSQLGVSYGNLAAGKGFVVGYQYDSGRLVAGNGAPGPYGVIVGQPYNLDDGRWHLFDVTYRSDVVTFYVDGVAAGRGTLPGVHTDATVGLAANGPAIDEVAVYPTALGAARVAAHWTAGSSSLPGCAPAPSGGYASGVLSDSPAAYYRLGDIATNSKGRVAFDSSGGCRNGSLRYTDRTTPSALVTDSDGALAGGFSAPAAALPSGAAPRTVEFWASAAGCCGTYGVGYGDVANGNGFELDYSFDSGVVTADDGQADFSQVAVGQPFNADDGRWHLFDAAFDGTTTVLYLDGVAIGSGAMAGLTTDTAIGLTGSARTLDEVAVYPTALSAARIAAHWTAGSSTRAACAATPTGAYASSVLAAHPTSYYRLGDIATNAKGRVAYDSSGHCNNGALRYTDTATDGALVGDGDNAVAGSFTAPGASLPSGAAARTVEFWTRTAGCCGSAGVTYGDTADGNGFAVTYTYDANRLSVGDGSSSIAQVQVQVPTPVDDGQWHLIDLVYTGTRATFYVDGTAIGSGPLANLTTDSSVGLTAYSQSVDEVAVYPSAVTAARISAHWNASGHA